MVLELDGEPALDVLLADLGVSLEQPREALARLRTTLVGLSRDADVPAMRPRQRPGQFGADVIVRHIIGLDPARRGVAIADVRQRGHAAGFLRAQCRRPRAPTWCASAPKSAKSWSPRSRRWKWPAR